MLPRHDISIERPIKLLSEALEGGVGCLVVRVRERALLWRTAFRQNRQGCGS